MSGWIFRIIECCRARQINGSPGNGFFADTVETGKFFNPAAIFIAGGKIHFAVGSRWVGSEDALDDTVILDKLPPVLRRDKSQAGNSVGHRNLVGGLTLTLGPD